MHKTLATLVKQVGLQVLAHLQQEGFIVEDLGMKPLLQTNKRDILQ
jgi:hypothetical protein